MILNLEETDYWTNYYNCKLNQNKFFSERSFNDEIDLIKDQKLKQIILNGDKNNDYLLFLNNCESNINLNSNLYKIEDNKYKYQDINNIFLILQKKKNFKFGKCFITIKKLLSFNFK